VTSTPPPRWALRIPSVLRQEPQFRLLFIGQVLSILGNRVTSPVLPFAVLAVGGQVAQLAHDPRSDGGLRYRAEVTAAPVQSLSGRWPTRRNLRCEAEAPSRSRHRGRDSRKSDHIAHRKRHGARGGRPPSFGAEAYKTRNVIERSFEQFKQWRGIATRYDKLAISYRGGTVLVISATASSHAPG